MIKVPTPTQGDTQPLPSHTPLWSFYQSCIPSLGSGGGSHRGRTLSHCGTHAGALGTAAKTQKLGLSFSGNWQKELPVLTFLGKWMSNTPPLLEVFDILQSFHSTRNSFLRGSWACPHTPAQGCSCSTKRWRTPTSNTPQLSEPRSAWLGSQLQTPIFNVSQCFTYTETQHDCLPWSCYLWHLNNNSVHLNSISHLC